MSSYLLDTTIRSNIANSVDLVLHIARVRGRRVVVEALKVNSYCAERDEYEFTDP